MLRPTAGSEDSRAGLCWLADPYSWAIVSFSKHLVGIGVSYHLFFAVGSRTDENFFVWSYDDLSVRVLLKRNEWGGDDWALGRHYRGIWVVGLGSRRGRGVWAVGGRRGVREEGKKKKKKSSRKSRN